MTAKEKIIELREMLQKAVELEFATIPPYLTTAFSIYPKANRSSFEIIHSVYMEEMLHMILAANVLNAIGGTVMLGKENIPEYPLNLEFKGEKFKDREFDINLERFSLSAIDTFMKIELPDNWEEKPTMRGTLKLEVPGYTIGEFYNAIKTKLSELCEETSEEQVFTGDPTHQIGEDYYWSGGGKPFEVSRLKDALDAIDVIIEQGEGASPDSLSDGDDILFGQQEEVAHFFRFNEIFVGKRYKMDDHPRKPPTGEILPIEWDKVYPIKSNCKSADFKTTPQLANLNMQFNQHYTLMVKGIEEALQGNRKSLYSAIMNDMHGMARIAYQMVQIPIQGDKDGQTGAPSFELIDLTS